ncbi:Ubiquitin-specific-processing protease 16 [Hyphodiscus hymeniophilus]|uniref:Ubiquitin carboxyl-terminal hydrolase n=1 Tax=Hyphodiscus hymeniophilus TaxID=353542 RepID=A0A9P7AY92_9HELO|nr:Ubiquitin-specific-processing protease 16 [Hyphodiscus hymeniophilus]
MPEKPLTIATYAAGASLAAITLVYVFGPTFFIDGDAVNSASTRKKGVVGLVNPANDCFINSVLQALAGLGDLRLYLIRETHRRRLDEPEVYAHLVDDPARKNLPPWKIEGLQSGMVTKGLKDILDALNERPLYKKTISAAGFVGVLEQAFKQRISRQQQDAQEFLQVVAERLCDEYHAGHRARNHARKIINGDGTQSLNEEVVDQRLNELALENVEASQPTLTIAGTSTPGATTTSVEAEERELRYDEEEGFPLEGGSESQIECMACGFKPKATQTTFCSLTLSVPQVSSTSLSSCFDQMFKTEYIEDFKCEKCRLVHALEWLQQELSRSNSENFKSKTQAKIDRLQEVIENDPEEDVKDVELPDGKFAPKRKIAKHVRITKFPKVMAIHLSRSIFDVGKSTMKNSAKISFPERLPLGGLLNQRTYKLLSVVCHKGSHHSGHYESFRRQNVYPPFATQNPFQVSGVYSKPTTPTPSQISTPQVSAAKRKDDANGDTSTLSSTPELLSPMSATSSSSLPYTNGKLSGEFANGNGRSIPSSGSASTHIATTAKAPGPTSALRDPETSSLRSIARSARSTLSKVPTSLQRSSPAPSPTSSTETKVPTAKDTSRISLSKRKRNPSNRWWRISDEKIKECKTGDVLGMQKEVYMLFYELEPREEDE